MGVAWVTWPNFEMLGPPKNFWTNWAIHFKFGTDVEDGASVRRDPKTTSKLAWPGSRDLLISGPLNNVWTNWAIHFKFRNHKGRFLLTPYSAHWKVFWCIRGKMWLPGQIDPKGIHPLPNHVLWCIERKSTLLRLCCAWVEGNKKRKKAREDKIILISPAHPAAAATVVCLWDLTVDAIKRVKFQLIRLGVSERREPKMTLLWFGASSLQQCMH